MTGHVTPRPRVRCPVTCSDPTPAPDPSTPPPPRAADPGEGISPGRATPPRMVNSSVIGSEVERSVARSRHRMRVLVMLSSVGEAHPGQLARLCGLSTTRIKWIMGGHWPQYSPELSLISLNLADLVHTPHGRVYR